MKWLMRILSKGNKSKRGFTLIELMIVVIVVGILAAAAIPMYSRAMDRARGSEGKALLGTVRTHYLVETAEGTTLTYTNGTSTLLVWGIDTSTNRWWKVDPADFTTSWDGTTHVFTITGVHADIDNIQLAIDCATGLFTIENYSFGT